MPVKRDKQYPIRITYCCSQHFYPDLNNNNLSESELDPSPAQTQSHPVLTHISDLSTIYKIVSKIKEKLVPSTNLLSPQNSRYFSPTLSLCIGYRSCHLLVSPCHHIQMFSSVGEQDVTSMARYAACHQHVNHYSGSGTIINQQTLCWRRAGKFLCFAGACTDCHHSRHILFML